MAQLAAMQGNVNYYMASNCQRLTGVSATVTITNDLVWQSSSTTRYEGLTFQLNCWSLTGYGSAWQQFCIYVYEPGVGRVGWVVNQYDKNGRATTAPVAESFARVGSLTIPAGFRFKVALEFDDVDKPIAGATYTMVDNKGVTSSRHVSTIKGHRAPITVFTMNIVDVGSGSVNAIFSSGAGYIEYHASQPLQVLARRPGCVDAALITKEDSNIVYDPIAMPAFTQNFSVGPRRSAAQVIDTNDIQLAPGLIWPRGLRGH